MIWIASVELKIFSGSVVEGGMAAQGDEVRKALQVLQEWGRDDFLRLGVLGQSELGAVRPRRAAAAGVAAAVWACLPPLVEESSAPPLPGAALSFEVGGHAGVVTVAAEVQVALQGRGRRGAARCRRARSASVTRGGVSAKSPTRAKSARPPVMSHRGLQGIPSGRMAGEGRSYR